jgi:hypothetical protein
MRTQTRLVRRGPVYYFRARIPEAFKYHFGGKAELNVSLKTKDKKEAERLVRVKSVELDGTFESLRQRQNSAPLRHISDDEIARIVAKSAATRMKADEEGRIVGLSDEDFAGHLRRLEEIERSGAAGMARGSLGAMEPMVDDWLTSHGYELSNDSADYRRFAFAFAKAQVRVSEQLRARNRGEAVDTPPMPAEPAGGARGAYTLDDLRQYWQKQKAPRSKTASEAESVIRRFREANGDIPPAKVQRRHVIALRDKLVEDGKAPGTVKKLLGLLGSMFQIAVEDDGQFGVETNPVRDVKVRGRVGEAKARKHFSTEELNAIFASPCSRRASAPRAGPARRLIGSRCSACSQALG